MSSPSPMGCDTCVYLIPPQSHCHFTFSVVRLVHDTARWVGGVLGGGGMLSIACKNLFSKVCHINYVLYQNTDTPSLNSNTQVPIPVYKCSC